MQFNSVNYFIFLCFVFFLNYIIPFKYRWILLLTSSILFYIIGSISTFFVLIIIILSTYICGLVIGKTDKIIRKKIFFWIGIIINLGILLIFKYINLIITLINDTYNLIINLFGFEHSSNATHTAINLIIPLGISYITFQTIGYLIEIYRRNKNFEKNIGIFATYIIFFPKLLAGPIERAHNFIPQLYEIYYIHYEDLSVGFKRMLWGLFLKIVIANRLSLYTDAVFNNSEQHSGITLLIATIFFTIQLFADFAGYTNIAIGSARILGFKLMENFNAPFIAKSITEFWGRWHISLSTWLRDYLFLPLSYSIARMSVKKIFFLSLFKPEYISYITAVIITMTICGIWHGASWNFVIFGLLQGIIMAFELLTRKLRKKARKHIPSFVDSVLGICFTFCFFSFSTIFFRVNITSEAFSIIKKICELSGKIYIGDIGIFIYSLLGIFILLLSGLVGVYFPKIDFLYNNNKFIRFFTILFLIIYMISFGVYDESQFIYFQF